MIIRLRVTSARQVRAQAFEDLRLQRVGFRLQGKGIAVVEACPKEVAKIAGEKAGPAKVPVLLDVV